MLKYDEKMLKCMYYIIYIGSITKKMEKSRINTHKKFLKNLKSVENPEKMSYNISICN